MRTEMDAFVGRRPIEKHKRCACECASLGVAMGFAVLWTFGPQKAFPRLVYSCVSSFFSLYAGVRHLYDDALDPGKHEWSWVWMKPGLDSLLLPQL